MKHVVYVCIGSCAAEITEAQYQGGLIACGATDCTLKGHAFEKRLKCNECGTIFAVSVHHSHH